MFGLIIVNHLSANSDVNLSVGTQNMESTDSPSLHRCWNYHAFQIVLGETCLKGHFMEKAVSREVKKSLILLSTLCFTYAFAGDK
jgi:hypothetical protein